LDVLDAKGRERIRHAALLPTAAAVVLHLMPPVLAHLTCSRVMKLQSWHDGPRVGEEMAYDTILRHLPLETGDLRSANTVVQFYRDWLAHPE
jgi:hypothetical protein